jgi:hypothetical protein
MTADYQFWVDHLAGALMQGDVGHVADWFRTPLPFFRPCGVRSCASRDQVLTELVMLRARLRAAGVRAMHGVVTRAEEGADRRFRLEVDWTYDRPRAAPLYAAVTYFGQRAAPDPGHRCAVRIEMLDYRREVFPMGDAGAATAGARPVH